MAILNAPELGDKDGMSGDGHSCAKSAPDRFWGMRLGPSDGPDVRPVRDVLVGESLEEPEVRGYVGSMRLCRKSLRLCLRGAAHLHCAREHVLEGAGFAE
jgi:hypothetical protein